MGLRFVMFDAKIMAQRVLLSRRDLDIDQKELARRSGVSNTYISDIERAKVSNVGLEYMFALAKALGVSPKYLLGFSSDPNGDDDAIPVFDEPIDALTHEFVSIFQQLDANKKKTLLDLARMLRSSDEPRIIGG